MDSSFRKLGKMDEPKRRSVAAVVVAVALVFLCMLVASSYLSRINITSNDDGGGRSSTLNNDDAYTVFIPIALVISNSLILCF